MKKFFIPVLAAATMMTAASCSKKSTGPSTPQAQIGFFNGYLLGQNLNVTAGGAATTSNLGFLKASGYQNVTAGSLEIKFLQSTTSGQVTDSTITLAANTHYSYFMGGLLISPAQIVTVDDVTTPAAGMSEIRFVNLSPDTTGYNIYVGSTGTALVTNMKFGSASGQVVVAASTGLLLQCPSNATKQINFPAQVFAAGKIYTIVLTGEATGTGTGALGVTVFGNN